MKKRQKKGQAEKEEAAPNARRFARARDGEVLRTLANGVKIIRRLKHEWSKSLDPSDREEFQRQTGPTRGSKFLPGWTLQRYVSWLASKLTELNWQVDSPRDGEATIRETAAVGYSNGVLVNTIKIVIDSGFVHAYPVGE